MRHQSSHCQKIRRNPESAEFFNSHLGPRIPIYAKDYFCLPFNAVIYHDKEFTSVERVSVEDQFIFANEMLNIGARTGNLDRVFRLLPQLGGEHYVSIVGGEDESDNRFTEYCKNKNNKRTIISALKRIDAITLAKLRDQPELTTCMKYIK